MNETGGLITVSEEERARIRAALQAYMRAHRIGVPRLCSLVIDSDPRQREMPLSTLQRFLRGKHRTGEAYVLQCAQFLEQEGFIAPADRNPVAEFGEAMAGFWAEQPVDEAALVALAGRYLRVQSQDVIDDGFVLTIATPQSGGYMTAREERIDGDERLRYQYEGVLVRGEGTILIALREVTSKAPRTYWLERLASAPSYSGNYLRGQATEMLFRAEDENGSNIRTEALLLESGRANHADD